MSDSKASTEATPHSRHRTANAIIGIGIVLLIAVLVNYIFGMFNPRIDLTENKIYTLTEGTKSIIDRLDTPVTVRFYAIDDRDYAGAFYVSMARNVENLLAEYKRRANGMITVKRFNPEPDTDAEDNAVFDGLRQGLSQETGNPIYFGISVESLDRKEVIPFIPDRGERLLEYDISRAILRAHDGAETRIRIMTTMQIGGGFSGGFNAPPQQPWFLVQSLRKDYEVEFLPATVQIIPEDTDVLIVLHPYDVLEETQFAIDQYLLSGGRVLVAVDPNFFASRFMAQGQQNPMMPQMGPQGGPAPSSNLNKLFETWGVQYEDNRVLADLVFQTQIQSGRSPTVLSLPPEAMNQDDLVTTQLNDVFMIMPGAFTLAEKDGIEQEILVQSSPSSQMISSFEADPTQRDAVERLRQNFNPSGDRRILAARLSGSFETAFPDGNPAAQPQEPVEPAEPEVPEGDDAKAKEETAEEKAKADSSDEAETAPEEKEESSDDGDDCQEEPAVPEKESAEEEKPVEVEAELAPVHLKKSEKDGIVVLFADSDFLHDQFATQPVQDLLSGQVILRPTNDNIALFENALELAAGGTDLIKVRSRTSNRRRFTLLDQWLEDAEAKFQGDLATFESSVRDVESNINDILSRQPENIEEALVSPEVQAELEKLRKEQVTMNRKVREIRKDMKREFDMSQLMIKLLTTGLVPVLIILFGIGLALSRKVRTAAR